MKIEFNNQQIQVLNAAICELPYRVAEPLIRHINAEIQKSFDASYGDEQNGQDVTITKYQQ